ncbi:cytochrome P450 alkane hydroxylase [Blastomyces gilchristii SLH14081]|uniref:Cytochrome P450 alkane hydroxylase n=1 Tax=Blastomyces gilchristii (strain SLH14081) TaxID=559298 RepID=A0A179UJB8_BLAGS|nr:cytochrome P450 alkane hydroxylase [Blastomyces gilchristii SLH14081]OAT07247.1 cytochrome P450 alkane hydroxylase [Blastomyces gilchristii SLH14081]
MIVAELIQNLTPARAVVGIFGFSFIVYWIRRIQIERKIRRLGSHAPVVPTYLPVGLDFICKSFKAAGKREELKFWRDQLAALPLPNGDPSSTLEINGNSTFRAIYTVDPENIKAVLTGQFADYGKGQRFHEEWREFLGDSIFATDGELWSRSRHLIRPMFARDRIVDTENFEKHIQKLIPYLEGNNNKPGKGKVVDVAALFFRFTLDAATDYLLGQSVDSLDDPKTVFAESFQYVLHRQSTLFRAGPISPLLSRKEFRINLKKMDDFMQPFIDEVLTLSTEELDKKLSKKDTFLHALARFTKDPKVIRDQLVAILLAGRDTTAATLSFCLFELSRNPTVVGRLRTDVIDRLGTSRKPSYSDLKEMKYLTAVLNETMRLYPVVPFNVRHALTDTSLPRGGGPDGRSPIGIPNNTRILYSTMNMQRRRDLYDAPPPPPALGMGVATTGSDEKRSIPYFDPLLWIPERWTSGWQPKPWHFIPFNGGPRICLGQQFAMLEMGYTVARILQNFSEIQAVGAAPVGQDPPFKFDVTLSPGEELNMVFVKGDKGE